MRDKIFEVCAERQDLWAVEVKSRLEFIIDLPAADAMYHHNCYTNFIRGRQPPCQSISESGRYDDSVKLNLFTEMCEWFESCNDQLCSLVELREWMIKKSGNEDMVYTVQSIKRKLIERYGDHLFFGELHGRRDIVCLKNMASYIINAKWYAERKENVGEESERIITAAARLIQLEIKDREYSKHSYPTNQDISNSTETDEWLPPLLNSLMKILVRDDLKQNAIAQSIVQAARPRSVISPLLFGLGVELDHLYRSELLVTKLARLGFSVSYDEVIRYKQSVLQATNTDSHMQSFPTAFTQWIADNVDHNVLTLDGLGTFHGMGVIAASTRSEKSPEYIREEAIVRLKRVLVKEVTRGGGIPIKLYCPPEKPALSTITLKTRKQLEFPYTLPQSVNLDLLWESGWLIPEGTCDQPNWSGFMQHISTGSHPPAANITMLPIIDMNPSDDHCIYSTLCFVEEQAKRLNIITPCITFDQPWWLKAVEIIAATKMNIVCRLGGFHTMMSFLGSIGTIMGGSGLSEALELCYGPNAVIHMLSGKSVARALRGYILVEAALSQILLQNLLSEISELDDNTDGTHKRLTENEIHEICNIYEKLLADPSSIDDLKFIVVSKLAECLRNTRG